MANKYLKGGALNPAWCDEQDAALATERIMSSLELLYNAFNNTDIGINLQLGEGVDVSISKPRQQQEEEICATTETTSVYEAKFNFIKSHSATPEDLELAKEIVGLK